MVAATGQHHGKTTVTLGMVQALLARNWKVAYQKPVGQQTGRLQSGSSQTRQGPANTRCMCPVLLHAIVHCIPDAGEGC